ncbi:MAG: DUF4446 family protein [Patescibacteria group bacterium]
MNGFDVALFQFIEAASENPVVSGLTVLMVFALTLHIVLFERLRVLLRGSDGKSLEGTIRKLGERAEALEKHAKETTLILKETDDRLARSVQGVSVKRFDPFQNAGGQQSFATALLSEAGDGVVISGIHARDGVRVYAKHVKGFGSVRELSEEEREAIAEAKKSVE